MTVFLWLFYAAILSTQPLAQPHVRVADLERRVHRLINDERANAKTPALAFDERLSAVARAHARDMARRRFFSHVNPDGEDPTARGKRAGYECRIVSGHSIREGLAENLFESSGSWRDDVASRSVRGWMKSAGHRRNILEKNYGKTGVGVATSGDMIFITQLFC